MARSNLWWLLAASTTLGVVGCQAETTSDAADTGTGGTVNPGGSGGDGQGGTPQGGDAHGGTTGGTTGGTVNPGGSGGTGGGDNGGEGGEIIGGNGGEGGLVTGGNGGEGGSVTPGLALGDECNADDDQCDEGLVCVVDVQDEDGTQFAHCYNACNTANTPDGCPPDAFCWDGGKCDPYAEDASCPGYCVPSQDCELCDASVACGGPATCDVITPITLCAQVGTAQPGDQCYHLRDDDGNLTEDPANFCVENTSCLGGTCVAPCGAGTDTCGVGGACGEGQVCADLGFKLNGLNFTFCWTQCSLGAQTGCGEGEVCTFVQGAQIDGNTVLMNECVEESQGEGTQGMPCEQSETVYWGNCRAGNYCSDIFGEGNPNICNGFCDIGDQAACLDLAACLILPDGANPGLEGLGFCVGECDPLGEGAECAAGEKCDFAIGVGSFGPSPTGDKAMGLCREGAYTVEVGGDCAYDENTGASDCVAGAMCLELFEGEPPVCVGVCDVGPESTHTCGVGFDCRTGILGSDAYVTETLGLCIPQER